MAQVSLRWGVTDIAGTDAAVLTGRVGTACGVRATVCPGLVPGHVVELSDWQAIVGTECAVSMKGMERGPVAQLAPSAKHMQRHGAEMGSAHGPRSNGRADGSLPCQLLGNGGSGVCGH